MQTKTPLPNGWTLVTLEDGRQRAYRKDGTGRRNVFGTVPPGWEVYSPDGNTVRARGKADTLEAAMSAADAVEV